MASGIKRSANRPKQPKHLRSTKTKRFKNEDPEAAARYNAKQALKMANRQNRRRRKKR